MTSPGGNAVHSVKGKSEDKFEFKATADGMHKFCFHNPTSVPETVSFSIHVGHIPNSHDLAKDGSYIFPLFIIISTPYIWCWTNFVHFHMLRYRTFGPYTCQNC